MAQLTGSPEIFAGDTSVVDTSLQYKLGSRAFDVDGNEYVYVKGVSSGAVGKWVTFDENGVTSLLAANAIGPVGVMMAALDSTSKYGFIQVFGEATASLAANCADNAALGRETNNGYAGDGYSSGDMIAGAISRGSTSGASANTTVQLSYPFVTDNSN